MCVLIVVSGLTAWLLTLGAKSADVTNALSLGVALLAYLLPQGLEKLWQHMRNPPAAPDPEPDPAPGPGPGPGEPPPDPAPPPPRPRRVRERLRRFAPIALALLLGVGVPMVIWFGLHKPDVNVTDRVHVGSGSRMQNGSTAVLSLPNDPDRDALSLTLTLTNSRPFGDCVVPASLRATSSVDGRATGSVTVRPGKEAHLPLGKVERQARVTLRLHEPDRSCHVDLGVAEAVLYNRGIL
ncbi:hypothetical protein JQK87_18015 [Streptomyces sp. G44]|uniref:hypothetical protein n=1 Tax=Streptomyces sp. G44 TaxID=2807632 RepID=UPI00195F3F70|nr:hypothetical protein [Streptomyces sp. G44]MBM7170263.1 hypothetical protein [Streptomyces sp. G44]